MAAASYFTLEQVDERRTHMLAHLCGRLASVVASAEYVADVELSLFVACFPYDQLLAGYERRRTTSTTTSNSARRRELNETCVELTLQMISVLRWQTYRKRAAALVQELLVFPRHVHVYDSGRALIASKPWDRCAQLWESTAPARVITRKELEPAPEPNDAPSLFSCTFCGSKRTRNEQFQIRSADEGMTVFVTCLDPTCGRQSTYN